MVENPYVDNGWAERAPKLAPQGQLWYLPFQAVCQRDEDRRMRCCVSQLLFIHRFTAPGIAVFLT
ncbi:hypothetical protein T4D_13069 [Trichinella pseudospiralis]|uniref:Uncharacterized protein n=1 Tax=Trichinella pseudospiralis TaxID=6337 RepID=A0A0V1F4V0_TRIPS|nr:hypothetical protein T4D_8518 [Trichinella pseudospiralis]KRY81023.1 hypothetical protein T4D_6292 [Trichinella pseudospiralis]KRY81035.1 hypothetical protein T4D_13069 [Trichinella pseudospiralis]